MKNVTFCINNTVFPVGLRIICGDREFVKQCAKKFYKGADIGCENGYYMYTQHLEMPTRGVHEVIIVMDEAEFTCPWYGALAHECVHVATHIMEILPIPINRENDEVTAYLAGWAMQETLVAFRLRDKLLMASLQKKKKGK